MLFFTWGSVLIIGLVSKYFVSSLIRRLAGVLSCAFIFYIITNFGVWTTGSYGYNFEGLLTSYILALPFFGYTFISTLVFSVLIETVYKLSKFNFKISNN